MGCALCKRRMIGSPIGKLMLEMEANRANEELLSTIQFLRLTPLFRRLDDHDYPILAAACTRQTFLNGQEVVSAGNVGSEFYVVVRGTATAWTDMTWEHLNQMSQSPVRSTDARMFAPPTPPRKRLSGNSPAPMSPKRLGSSSLTRIDDIVVEGMDPKAEGRPLSSDAASSFAQRAPKAVRSLFSWGGGGLQGMVSTARSRGDDGGPKQRRESEGTGSRESATSSWTVRSHRNVKVATYHARDWFGDNVFFLGEAWDSTIRVESDKLECIKISRESLQALEPAIFDKLCMPKRQAFLESATVMDEYRGQLPAPKAEDDADFIRAALAQNEALQSVIASDDELLEALVTIASRYEFTDGHVLVAPQEQPPPCLYILQEGSLIVHHMDAEAVEQMTESRAPNVRRMSLVCVTNDTQDLDTLLENMGGASSSSASSRWLSDGQDDEDSKPSRNPWREKAKKKDAVIKDKRERIVALEQQLQTARLEAQHFRDQCERLQAELDAARAEPKRIGRKNFSAEVPPATADTPVNPLPTSALPSPKAPTKENSVHDLDTVLAPYRARAAAAQQESRKKREAPNLTINTEKFGSEATGSSSCPNSPSPAAGRRRRISKAGGKWTSKPRESLLEPGDCYGQQTLLYDSAHTGRVQSVGRTVVWSIAKADWVMAPRLAAERRWGYYAELLREVDEFSTMLSYDIYRIAKVLTEERFPEGHVLYDQADATESFDVADWWEMKAECTFYILLEGEVALQQDAIEIQRLRPEGEERYFGRHALTTPEASPSDHAAVVVSEDGAKCLSLSRKVLRTLPLSAPIAGIKGRAKKESSTRIDMDDLEEVSLLGQGGFGMVTLCEHRTTGALYAVKSMKKFRIAKSEHLKKQVLNEKYILEMTDSNFIIKLYQTSKNDQEIFFFLEPCLGGELYTIYGRKQLFGLEVHARYYVASIILAFQHLHERFIIYRDLKPENLLLDQMGHLKLADMGLAKFIVGRTYTSCGTPAYLAPEVAKQSGYTCAADWWQLGILTWELLAGKPPFPAQSRGEAVYWLFTEGVLKNVATGWFEWPKVFQENARVFLKSLLVYNPDARAPVLAGGTHGLRRNPWYRDFSWAALESGKMPAPFLPAIFQLDSGTGPSGFNSHAFVKTKSEHYVNDGSGWDDIF